MLTSRVRFLFCTPLLLCWWRRCLLILVLVQCVHGLPVSSSGTRNQELCFFHNLCHLEMSSLYRACLQSHAASLLGIDSKVTKWNKLSYLSKIIKNQLVKYVVFIGKNQMKWVVIQIDKLVRVPRKYEVTK